MTDTIIDEVFIMEGDVKVARGYVKGDGKHYPPLMDSYADNPLITALPPLEDRDSFVSKIASKPDWKREYLGKPAHQRALMPVKVKRFFIPFDRHYSLAQGIYTLIHEGYVGRSPLASRWWIDRQARMEKIMRTPEAYLPDSIESAMLTGMSGLGKSVSVARILQKHLPQVIVHESLNGKSQPHTQVVWIYLSCPHNASVIQLSSQFLREIDMALRSAGKDANFHDKHVKQHSSSAGIFTGLCEVALECSVGLVVIDELQHLTALNFGGAKLLLNFIVQLQNTLGVPILLVGNGSANYVLAESFRMVRRSTYLPDPHWGRLKADSTEWNDFVESIWNFQYLSPSTPLTSEIKSALYEKTAGIPDVASDLFKLVQMRAINNKREVITPELIATEAQASLPHETRKLVDALIKRKFAALGQFEDLHSSDFDAEELTESEFETAAAAMAAAREQKERGKRRKAAREGAWVPGSRG
jgi:hypothetical protein